MAPPVLVYDEDCDFCTRSARFIERHSSIRIVGFDDLTADLEARLPAGYRACAHFVTDEAVYSCGEAVEQAFARTDLVPAGLVGAARAVPGYGAAREWVYGQVADNRGTIGRLLP